MPRMIDTGSEMLRINPANNHIEYSTDGGCCWYARYTQSCCGEFRDLLEYDGDLYAATSHGVYRSTDDGFCWYARFAMGSCGEFLTLCDGGDRLFAQTSAGLYYSFDGGCSWYRRP